MKWLLRCTALIIFSSAIAASAQTSDWAKIVNGKLTYKTFGNGNHIMDFSSAGYMGGGVALPTVPAKITLNPSGGDDSSAIQVAINKISAMPLSNGFRGALVLGKGTFHVSSTLNVAASGVVVRGSGSGTGGTVVSTTVAHVFNVAGTGTYQTFNTTALSGSYIPSGAQSITVASTAGFLVGDNVVITRTVTAAWIHFMGMDKLVRNGQPQTWLSPGSQTLTDRTITAISGNMITLDGPITDSFDAKFLGTPVGTISKYDFPGRISQAGIEHLKIQAPVGTEVFNAITMSAVMDGWISDVVGQETQNAFSVNRNCRRITLDHVINNNTTRQTNAAAATAFDITGTQVLLNKCAANSSGMWPIATSALGAGPIVVLNFTSTENHPIEPHQRWTTGLLTDNAKLPNSGVDYINRRTDGSGHGWCMGWGVAWNDTAPRFTISAAPGTTDWCIGCVGAKVSNPPDPDGTFDSLNTHVVPASLYLEQLKERLGQQALTNIGY
ncbi:MAG TPA: hypothetical protein VFA71_05860 [Terriglobales bacterium]|nr:hypothetical protein [Terriglobales bacterium]